MNNRHLFLQCRWQIYSNLLHTWQEKEDQWPADGGPMDAKAWYSDSGWVNSDLFLK
jgi:hypothetical protein